jgi:hypothetical protein
MKAEVPVQRGSMKPLPTCYGMVRLTGLMTAARRVFGARPDPRPGVVTDPTSDKE